MLPSPIPNGGDTAAFCPFGHRRPSPPPSITMEEVWKDINLHEISVPQPNLRRASGAPLLPATAVLSLSSGPDFYFPAEDHPGDDSPVGRSHPLDAFASSALASFGEKRLPEGGKGDRRHKRMMKNRESAARSRARKQAYINGLRLKIGHLKEENDKLREQHKKLMLLQAEPVLQRSKNHLQRTSTAPF